MKPTLRTMEMLAVAVVLAAARPALAQFPAGGSALAVGDFNCDGIDDLAVGKPGAMDAQVEHAGLVQVYYGEVDLGLVSPPETWTQSAIFGAGGPKAHDTFGTALAAGLIDGDSCDDLAIGIPGKDAGAATDVGAVVVLYSDGSGLALAGAQVWTQSSQAAGNTFGAALAVFDSPGTGGALAVGAPNTTVGGKIGAGAVNVIYAGENGLVSQGRQTWTQNVGSVQGTAQTNDHFGAALAAWVSKDLFKPVLAIGAPDESVDGDAQAGVVHVLFGGAGFGELDDLGNQLWHQDTNVVGEAESGDKFGSSIVIHDGEGGETTWAVGAIGEHIPGHGRGGAVHVIYGIFGSPNGTSNEMLHQATAGIHGLPDDFDQLGFASAFGYFDDDHHLDFVVGVPAEDVTAVVANSGVFHLVPGDSTGLDPQNRELWEQDTDGSLGDVEAHDQFGFSLVVGNFNGDHSEDLAVGAPTDGNGLVSVLYGAPAGLQGEGSHLLSP